MRCALPAAKAPDGPPSRRDRGDSLPVFCSAVRGARPVVYYILIVALVNLGLGFAVAWHLGRRYRELVILAVEAAVPPGTSATGGEPLPEPPEAPEWADEVAPAAEPLAKAGDEAQPATAPADGGDSAAARAESRDPPATSSTDAACDREGPAEPEKSSDAAPESNPPVSPGVASAEHFRSEVDQYHRHLTRLDDAIRDCMVKPDAATVRSCVDSLREANADYRASRDKAHRAFQDIYDGEEAFQHALDELQAILTRQDARIEEADNAIRNLDLDADLGGGCRQIVQATSRLLDVNHHLRDALDEAAVRAARHSGRLRSIDQSTLTDELTGLSNRAGLEACLADWWKRDPHRVRQLNAAMIDVDEFGRVNERHGRDAGDRVLRATARLLTGESRNHLLAARYAGQRFVLLFPDVDLRFATNLVERIRQTIEMTRLEYRGKEIRLTVSCAVTEVGREDTSDTLYARAEATLHEAKRYGRNRTFYYEGKYPTPAVPPNFSLEERSVAI